MAGNIDNADVLQIGNGTIDKLQPFTVGGNLTNHGTLFTSVAGQAAGSQLVVNGDYVGNGGNLIMNTVLGGGDSVTDKLIVKGDTIGTTLVSVNNVGGQGADTLNGIELINVAGQSNGICIVAGAYDYSLVRGTGTGDKNWYLVNDGIAPTPDPTPTPKPKPRPNIRPEGGSYVANLAAANTLFNTRLHDRSGETRYVDPVTGEALVSSLWLRQVGSHTKWRDGSGQLKTQSNSYVAQLGGDFLQWSSGGIDEGHLGLMAGYANSHSNTSFSRTGYDAKGSLNGYSVGAYATWFANKKEDTGLYVDS